MFKLVRRLIFNNKFYYLESVLTLLFLFGYIFYSFQAKELNVFLSIEAMFHLVLTISMVVAYKTNDIVDLSGYLGCVLALKLAKYAFLLEQYYQTGRTAILEMGLPECITMSCTLMIFFVICLITFNHFTISLKNISGKTKFYVNRLLIVVLLSLFIIVSILGWVSGKNIVDQLSNIFSYLSDFSLFICVVCSELIILIENGEI